MKKLNSILRRKIQNRVLSVLVILFLISNAAKAQWGGAFGVKAGFNTTSFYGSSANNITAIGGGLGGVFLCLQPSPVFSLQPELFLSQNGGKFVYNDVKNNIKFSTLDFPILLKFRIPVQNTLFPYVEIGPEFVYNTNISIASYDNESGEEKTVITSDNFGKTDFAGVAGFGLDLELNPIFFTLDWRYNYGFVNTVKTSNDYLVDLKNRGWTLSAGIGLQFGRK